MLHYQKYPYYIIYIVIMIPFTPSHSFVAIFFFLLCMCSYSTSASADDYATRQARSYISDAEYKMRQAENLRRDADYYKRQAESNQRDASYYTRKGDVSRAKDYQRRAEKNLDTYNSKLRDAKRADLDAADYLRRAANKLSY